MKLEIINSTNSPVIIKKNIKVTGFTLAEKGKLSSERNYNLEIEGLDSSHVILPAWGCESYIASSRKNQDEQLSLHLYLVKVSVGFYGKCRKQTVIYYYLQEPKMEISFWQYLKRRMRFWWFHINPNKKTEKLLQIMENNKKTTY